MYSVKLSDVFEVCENEDGAIEPCLGIYLELYTETATAINAWIDDLILTDEG